MFDLFKERSVSICYQTADETLLLTRDDNKEVGVEEARQEKNLTHHFRESGLTVLWAAVFIAGEMAGSGVLALPKAVVDAGWIGLVLIVCFCVNAGYGGTRLGACWTIIEERYPEHRTPVRNPYPIIALIAFGRKTSLLVSGCIQLTLFGAGTVYLLLASQIIQELLEVFLPHIRFCEWFLVIALLISPAMWLGTPKDFRVVGIGAILTTAFACIFIFMQIVMDKSELKTPMQLTNPTFHSFFLAFGTILFSFGGASTFPTIQNDMLQRDKFSKSVIIGFIVILILYLPVAAGGYAVYGDSVNTNIILNLKKSLFVILANILLAIHLVLAFLIVINPVCQDLEERFNIPRYFNWKRCVLRTVILGLMVFLGESIPDFGKILALVGGSTITMTTFVFPPLFYMALCDQSSDRWTNRSIPLYLRVYMWELILIGVIGGAACTYNALSDIFDADSMNKPCYVRAS
ncbi:hypothetical protein R5R35_006837 [Gryllus longicercus]|uniref:Amino acid transporter transmembrane domain-containing protein n=1 Tax=Gryllus longicercus TaxID=2509291 RepID=A0AAN9VL93_9ORTH